MNSFKRCIKSLVVNRTRTILLILLFFIVNNLIFVALGVSNAASQAKLITRQSMNSVVNYAFDYDALADDAYILSDEEYMEQYFDSFIKLDELDLFADDQRIITYNAIMNDPVVVSMEPVQANPEYPINSHLYYNVESGWDTSQMWQSNFIISTNIIPDLIELHNGTYTIVDGRFYTQDDIDNLNAVCLITEEIADLNNLDVGDMISLNMFNEYYYLQISGGIEYTDIGFADLEIIGIYTYTEQNNNYDSGIAGSTITLDENKILMPAQSYLSLRLPLQQRFADYLTSQGHDDYIGDKYPSIENTMFINAVTFLLNDSEQIESFVNDYQDEVVKYRKFVVDTDYYRQIIRPFNTVESIANVLLIIVMVNTVIILSLIGVLFIKIREREIGILMALGTSRFRIVLQFLCEFLIVAMIGLTLSLFSGNIIGNKIGEELIHFQINTNNSYASEIVPIQVVDDSAMSSGYLPSTYFSEITVDDALANYQVEVNFTLVVEIVGIQLLTILIITCISSLFIMRYNPKQIMETKG